MESIFTFENKHFCLKLAENGLVESLVYKAIGEECIDKGEKLHFFSITEERPFNNEVKLAHPNKKMTFQGNKIRQEGDKLIVGFELMSFEAIIKVNIKDDYITFKLEGFNCPDDYIKLDMDEPPVYSLRLISLPVIRREKFGEWLNVEWDDKVAVNVLSTSPYEIIDSENRRDVRVMYADAMRDIKLIGSEAALIVSSPDDLMDCIEKIEIDYNLPHGVESRKSEKLNRSMYWVKDLCPENLNIHLANMKKGGFTMMTINHRSLFKDAPKGDYWYLGDYDYWDTYPEGEKTLKEMLDKIKAEGITPGIHILHSHIGNKSKYVTPVTDYRLNLTRHFTLSKPLGENDTTVYVAQNPQGSVMSEKCRVLRFGGELIYYNGYTTEPPYCFTDCVRGHFNTNIVPHDEGTIGGIHDVTEYGGGSCYIDQTTDLQDEIADVIAKFYKQGFEYVYFDGSEGVDAPYEFYVPYAQYRVYKKLDREPIFCEGAAKSHFSWHMISGGNAFDFFPMNVFKECIAKYPLEEVAKTQYDFTRVNFGWWNFNLETQADIFEYGTSKAASWDCPITLLSFFDYRKHPRYDDIFEVLRRWEDVRVKNWLTKEQKDLLKNPDIEYTLLVDEKGEYILVPYEEVKTGNNDITVFVFEKDEKTCAVLWHKSDKCKLKLDIASDKITYKDEYAGNALPVEADGNSSVINVEAKAYLSSTLSKEEFVKVLENAVVM